MAEEKNTNKPSKEKKEPTVEKEKKEEMAAPKEVVKEKEKTEEKLEDKIESIPAVKKVASKKESKNSVELEREYVVPLRRGFLNVPRYKRAKKAVKTLKEFLAKHMKVENRDLSKIKIDMYLNNEIWFRGIKKPCPKIKVKAKKIDGIVFVELAELPDVVKYAKARADKQKLKAAMAKVKAPKKTKEEKEGEKTKEEKKEESEKEKSSVEAGLVRQEKAAKTAQHTTKGAHKQKTMPVRKALKK